MYVQTLKEGGEDLDLEEVKIMKSGAQLYDAFYMLALCIRLQVGWKESFPSMVVHSIDGKRRVCEKARLQVSRASRTNPELGIGQCFFLFVYLLLFHWWCFVGISLSGDSPTAAGST